MIEGIRATGGYLLQLLVSEKVVRYSRFYNDAPGTVDRLVAGAMAWVMDGDVCDAETIRYQGHVLLDFAAWQLKDLGIVQIEELDENLMDGYPDFQIALTKKGAKALDEGLVFNFRRLDYRITATPASEWLVLLLEAGGEGMDLTLSDVMDFGDSDGNVEIEDDHGNIYQLGTRTFAWAFEVSLWHHARAGHIEPACETAEQKKLWSGFIANTDRPCPPDMDAPHPLWQIPFRLADAFYREEIQIVHVGEIEA